MAEREGFVSSNGVEKRQAVDFRMSTMLTMSTLFEKSVHKRYTAKKTNNAEWWKCSDAKMVECSQKLKAKSSTSWLGAA